MSDYRIRQATLADADVLVRHRTAMFEDMGVAIDREAVGTAFRAWLMEHMPTDRYLAWIVENSSNEVVSGGGISIIQWPPGPWDLGGRLAFVYNVYTEPAHRARGLARLVMRAIHDW